MKKRLSATIIQTVALALAAQFILTVTAARAQLDETCTVTVNGQTVNVGFGGEFRIPNIPASNNLVRVYAICTKNGKTRYGRSMFYQVRAQQSFVLSELDMVWRDTPFPTTATINAMPDSSLLTQIGSTTQVRVTATLSDNTQKDVTARGFGSTYTSSNPGVVIVDVQGRVTATGIGTALITVNNEGATAVTRITIAPPRLLATIEGIVQLENGSPALGATVLVPGVGETIVTDPNGRFSFANIFTPLGALKVRAYNIVNNQLLLGIIGNLKLIPAGIIDAGIITIKPATNFVYWKMPVSGSWHDPTMWSTGTVPTANDNVLISVPGDITVTLTQQGTTNTINSLICDEIFVFNRPSLAIADSSEVTNLFTLNGGTLFGTGDLAIFGSFSWINGSMSGSGALNIAATGSMTFSNTTAQSFLRTINNSGITSLSGTGTLFIGDRAFFNNLANGVLDIQADLFIRGFAGGNGTFTNAGIVRKSAGAGTTTIFDGVSFNNNGGIIDVRTGALTLASGGISTGGVFTAATGASLNFSGGTHVMTGTYSGSVAGLVQLIADTIRIDLPGATFNFTGSGFQMKNRTAYITGTGVLTNMGNFTMFDGIWLGACTLNNRGIFTWTGGSIGGAGSTNILVGSTLNISGPDAKTSLRTINNSGMTIMSGTGALNIRNGSIFNNLVNGVFDMQADANFATGSGNPGDFNNAGTFRKSAGAGISTFNGPRFNNSGRVDVLSGTLRLSTGGTSTGGVFTAAAGASLLFSGGTHVLKGTYSGSGAGLIQLSGGTMQIDSTGATFNFADNGFQISGGTLSGSGILNNVGSLVWAGGFMEGMGTTNILPGSTLNLSGPNAKTLQRTINNSGTTVMSGTGVLNIANASIFNNFINSVFDIQADANVATGFGSAGDFNNAGTLRKSAGTGTSAINGPRFNSSGPIDVLTGTLALGGGNNTGGNFTVASGAILDLAATSGSAFYTGTYTGSGDGAVRLGANATLNIGAASATFNFPDNLFQWTGGNTAGSLGSIAGPGVLTNIGMMNLSGLGNKRFDAMTFENTGTVRWSGTGNFWLYNGAVFNNRANGTFDIQTDAMVQTFSGATGNFNNTGTVRKSGGTGTSRFSGANFNNSNGTINVEVGTLALGAGTNTGGKITVASGAILDLTAGGGIPVYTGTYAGSGAGTIRQNSGTLNIATAGATFNFSGNTFQWTGGNINGPGVLTNIGTFNISSANPKNLVSDTLRNSGTVNWTGTGSFNLSTSSVFNNLVNGVFDMQSDATLGTGFGSTGDFNNAGTLRKSAGTGTSTISSPRSSNSGTVAIQTGILSFGNGYTHQTSSSNLNITISGINAGTGFGQHVTTNGITTLAGNLNVSLNNFTPAVGNSFQVMTFVNRNNTQFAKINLPVLPPGRIWGPPVYTNTSLTLSVVAGGAER